ncbi:hypothetical protein [Gracilibacillus sp. JCM 18860]|uniref:hypothetical protein n=1 Tax=Gracilibacillus sp. JCM 18860 TaxID=1306159 RepID=UPI003261A873
MQTPAGTARPEDPPAGKRFSLSEEAKAVLAESEVFDEGGVSQADNWIVRPSYPIKWNK